MNGPQDEISINIITESNKLESIWTIGWLMGCRLFKTFLLSGKFKICTQTDFKFNLIFQIIEFQLELHL